MIKQEKIDLLAKQCYSYDHMNFDYNRFAKMIVLECIETILDCSIEYTNRPRIADELKEHFRIKE